MQFQKKRCVAMLLAGGQGSRLMVLTENTAKPAVPFGGFDFQPTPVHAVRKAQGEYAYSGTFRVPPMSVCFYQHVRSNPEK